jgi:hypothetical protein
VPASADQVRPASHQPADTTVKGGKASEPLYKPADTIVKEGKASEPLYIYYIIIYIYNYIYNNNNIYILR